MVVDRMVGRMTQMTHCCWPLTSFSPRFCRHALVVFFLLALMLFYVSTTAGGPTPAFSIGVPTTTTTTGIVKPNDTEPPPEIMLLPSGFDEPRLPNVSETMAKNLTNGSLVVPTPNGPTTTTTGLSLAPSMPASLDSHPASVPSPSSSLDGSPVEMTKQDTTNMGVKPPLGFLSDNNDRNKAAGERTSFSGILDPGPAPSGIEVVQACDRNQTKNAFIFCYGRILEAVNALRIFNDSKTFVDRPLKFPPEVVVRLFEKRFPASEPEKLTNESLRHFVEENFDKEATELMTCNLSDWQDNPPLLVSIRDDTLREWALKLNEIWRHLCRQIDQRVHDKPELFSLIYVPGQFVVPGGRFREFYYWDAYWIIKGLLVSGMLETAKHMIENFMYLVNEFGFVPNGGRVYYLRRSQPPLLAAMVYEYYEETRDSEFVLRALPILERELEFWEKNRRIDVEVEGQNYTVFQYRAGSNVPRPESYREDVEIVKQLTKPADKHRIWKDISTAAESGWDFSTRWMRDPEQPDLRTIEITNIAEVDLNAFLCWNYDILSYLYLELDNDTKSNEYRDRHYQFRSTFRKVFYVWNKTEDKAGWYDYNVRSQQHNMHFYPSIAVPLFTRCYRSINVAQAQRIFRTMEGMDVFKSPGGIPTSGMFSLIQQSGQQWDWPNGWPPLNHMIIEGLRRSGNSLMQKKAFWLAEKWVLANYRVFRETHDTMWEKYNVIKRNPKSGAGGEYEVQSGFGWTNGVVLDLLATYGDRMIFHDLEDDPKKVAERVIGNEPKFDDAKLQANPSRLDGIEPVIQRDVPTATGGSSAAVSSQQQIVVVVPILALFMFSFLLTPIFRF